MLQKLESWQFVTNVKANKLLFTNIQKNHHDPPLIRDYPTLCSHIFWARLLFSHLKKPVLKFQKVEELKKSLLKIEAFQNYLKVAKNIKAYEERKFEEWKTNTLPLVDQTLKMNILKVIPKKSMSM